MTEYKIKLEGHFPKFIKETKPDAMSDDDYITAIIKSALIDRMNEKHNSLTVKQDG